MAFSRTTAYGPVKQFDPKAGDPLFLPTPQQIKTWLNN